MENRSTRPTVLSVRLAAPSPFRDPRSPFTDALFFQVPLPKMCVHIIIPFAFHVPRWLVPCLYTKCVHTRGGTYIYPSYEFSEGQFFRPVRFLPIRFIVPRSIPFRYNSFLLAIVVVVGYTPNKTSLPLNTSLLLGLGSIEVPNPPHLSLSSPQPELIITTGAHREGVLDLFAPDPRRLSPLFSSNCYSKPIPNQHPPCPTLETQTRHNIPLTFGATSSTHKRQHPPILPHHNPL
jgi:hypothetical protein